MFLFSTHWEFMKDQAGCIDDSDGMSNIQSVINILWQGSFLFMAINLRRCPLPVPMAVWYLSINDLVQCNDFAYPRFLDNLIDF